MRVFKLWRLLFLVVVLSSCGILNQPPCHPALCGSKITLVDSLSFDDKKLAPKLTTVVTFAQDNSDKTQLFRELVVSSLRDKGVLSKDEKLSPGLRREIEEAVFERGGRYRGGSAADYALSIKLDHFSGSGKYTPKEVKTNKDGERYETGDYCAYSFSYTGRIAVTKLPELTSIDDIEFSDSDSVTENGPRSRSCRVGSDQATGQLRKIIGESLGRGDSANLLISILSPKYYVYEAYEVKGRRYYLTNIRKQHGAREGGRVKLYSESEDGNLRFIGDGKLIGMDYSNGEGTYMKVSADVEPYIQRGTVLKMAADKCGFLSC